MSSDLRLRAATAADIPIIAQLHTDSWLRTYRGVLSDAYLDDDLLGERHRAWSTYFASPPASQLLLLAEHRGAAVAFACAIGADDPDHGTLLSNLHVKQSLQGRGFGAILVREVARWTLFTHPGMGLFLWALEANTAARQFYLRLGGEESGAKMWQPPAGPPVAEVRYTWARPQVLLVEKAEHRMNS
ncbi:MAG: GNAT family N-acetyltransferase [Gemmatimonadaceae bacterium]|nr:GNAT family N-acetyltransferase [Gemmatimonadaceae bacterium]